MVYEVYLNKTIKTKRPNVVACSGCHNKSITDEAASTTDDYFSLVWRLDIQEQGTDRFSVWWGPGSWSINGIFSLSPHRVEGARRWSVCVCVCVCSVTSSLPGFSIHGIFQARILELVSISFSRESSWLRDQTRVSCVSCLGRRILSSFPPGKPGRVSVTRALTPAMRPPPSDHVTIPRPCLLKASHCELGFNAGN